MMRSIIILLLGCWAVTGTSEELRTTSTEKRELSDQNLDVLFTNAELHILLDSVPSTMDESLKLYFSNACEDFMHKNLLMPTFGIINFAAKVKGQATVQQPERQLLRGVRRATSERSLAVNLVISVEYTHPDGAVVNPQDFHRYLRLLVNTRGGDFIAGLREAGGSYFQDINRIYTHSSTIKYDTDEEENANGDETTEENPIEDSPMEDPNGEGGASNEGMNGGTIAIVVVAVAATVLFAAAMFVHRLRNKPSPVYPVSKKSDQSPFTLEELSDFLGSYPVVRPVGADIQSPSTWGSSEDASLAKYTTEHINLLDVPEMPRPSGCVPPKDDDDSDFKEGYSPNANEASASPISPVPVRTANLQQASSITETESSDNTVPTTPGNSSQERSPGFQKYTTEHINLLDTPETPRPVGSIKNDEDSDYMEGYSPNPEVSHLEPTHTASPPAVGAVLSSGSTVPLASGSGSSHDDAESAKIQRYTSDHIDLLHVPETPRPVGAVPNDEDSDFLESYSPNPKNPPKVELTADSLKMLLSQTAARDKSPESPIVVEDVFSLHDSQSTELTANGKCTGSPKRKSLGASAIASKNGFLGDVEEGKKKKKDKKKKKKKDKKKSKEQSRLDQEQEQQATLQSCRHGKVEGVLDTMHVELDEIIQTATKLSKRNLVDDSSLEASHQAKESFESSLLSQEESYEPSLESKESYESSFLSKESYELSLQTDSIDESLQANESMDESLQSKESLKVLLKSSLQAQESAVGSLEPELMQYLEKSFQSKRSIAETAKRSAAETAAPSVPETAKRSPAELASFKSNRPACFIRTARGDDDSGSFSSISESDSEASGNQLSKQV